MEKGGRVRVIEKKVRGDDPVEYFIPTGVGGTSRVPEGVMTIEVSKNEEIFGEGKNGGKKRVGSAIRWGGANRGAYILRKESEEELLREMLIPT